MKIRRWFVAFLVLCTGMLCSCRQVQPEQTVPKTRVVTRIQVSYTHGMTQLQRTYSTNQKMETVLLYLRLIKEEGRAVIDPERLDGASCTITVEYSDGKKNVYYQRGDGYLSRNSRPWQRIDPKHGRWLRPMLENIPSDETR